MNGTKHISDLITTQDALKKGRINIIDAGVDAGRPFFALASIFKLDRKTGGLRRNKAQTKIK